MIYSEKVAERSEPSPQNIDCEKDVNVVHVIFHKRSVYFPPIGLFKPNVKPKLD